MNGTTIICPDDIVTTSLYILSIDLEPKPGHARADAGKITAQVKR